MSKNPSFEKLNVLIVEDNFLMQQLLKEILRSFHIREYRTANDGADGLQELQTFHADIVIVDWNMEILDGIDFTRLVRTSSDIHDPHVPIIMLTGYNEAKHIVEARDAGATEYLIKPVSAKTLYERFCTVIEKPRPFVKTSTFIGPDRRRTPATERTNKGRRSTD